MSDKLVKRVRDRLSLSVPARVNCRESVDFEWSEMTRLSTVTPFGAGFRLKHPSERGRLLHMTIAMPRQFRAFDYTGDQYKVFALVRYAHRAASPKDDPKPLFQIGVAFIGKNPPDSYEAEPSRRYEPAPSGKSMSAENEEIQSISDQRVINRLIMRVDMLIEVLDENADPSQTENAVTESISSKGATIFSSLPISVGRFVRLTSQQFGITTYAAVRARGTGDDGIPRIHVEFIEQDWPL